MTKSHQPNIHAAVGSSSGNKGRILRMALFVFAACVAVSCFFLDKSAYPFQFLRTSYSSSQPSVFSDTNTSCSLGQEELLTLERTLKKAAMGDKTVILTTLNDAWAEPHSIFDLFLESFHIGIHTRRLLNHLIVIALDPKAYARCLNLHPHCFALSTKGVNFSGEAYFMTPDYMKMMWRRIDFLHSVLELGYNFIFTDADIMWFRDPFPRLYRDTDFQIACDNYIGNSNDVNNRPNGGFNYVKSNNRTIAFYKFWYSSRETFPGYHDQDVLNKIKYDPFITKIGLKMRFLNTIYFGGFCEPSKDFNLVCTMHANCCYGLDSKVHDLKIVLEDWRKYMSSPPIKESSPLSSWSVPQNCRCKLGPLSHGTQ
ncbi:hypothetical protein L1049_028016 [Liquidambar formosana]|uniref:Nucleotide-diphospho-sugar transferase domain-containing protein n=1 Tax=Liquidambar formosana TaxID=63359 RepID=A0AAP0RI47_LIQFO